MNIYTKCVHGARDDTNHTGSVALPIYQTSTFAHPALGASTGYDYSRLQNPTREHAERCVANLEGGYDAVGFSTGMAAVAAVMAMFRPGDRVISSDDLYGGTVRLFNEFLHYNRVEIDYVDTGDVSAVERLITPQTRAVFVETPTNPMMRVTDISRTAYLCKARGILLIVDNTFLTPVFQRPLELGADIVVHSGTKYLGGHNDLMAGFAVVKTAELSEKVRFAAKTFGACLAPFDAFLLVRGLKTLALRMRKHEENALEVARWLEKCPFVEKIYYVGLPSHASFDVSKRQTTGFGGMISFEVDSRATVERILSNLHIITFAESLGGVETLITYPTTQTHAEVPVEVRERNGVTERLLRISVGVEDAADIIEDLKNAIA